MRVNWYKISLWLALVGMGLALYLLYERFTPARSSLCYVNSVVNCEESIRGMLANTLGIPTPLYGLVGYIIIALATWFKKARLFLAVAVFGVAFCLRITYLEIFVIRVLCPVCLACQIDMLALALLALLLNLPKKPD